MDFLVVSQTGPAPVGFTADSADVMLDSGMHLEVIDEVRLFREGCPTMFARVLPVYTHVVLESIRIVEYRFAIFAL